jgi:hypothetical protein
MDPFSLVAGSVGTLGVLVHSTRVLIELVSDVKDAPAEVLATSETAKALESELLIISTQVKDGTLLLQTKNAHHGPSSRIYTAH